MGSILRLHNVRHQYKNRTVLDIPEFKVPRGSIIGLAGPNGSGKSTMLRVLSCLEGCSSGSVFFENKAILPFDERARHLLTYLPQEPYLLKRSVFENISFGLKIRGQRKSYRSIVSKALELVGLPSHFADRQWYELSGGESQRVALASRLVLKPSCLMLDEPTASVDMESTYMIRRAISLAREEWGTTLVITSHHQSWLNDICDRIVYLYKGRLLDHSYKNVLLGPWDEVSRDLVSMQIADGQLLFASTPPANQTNAIIPANALRITAAELDNSTQNLSCLVTGIYANKKSSDLQISLSCGDQQLIMEIAESNFLKEDIRPNKKVTVFYQPTDVIWIN